MGYHRGVLSLVKCSGKWRSVTPMIAAGTQVRRLFPVLVLILLASMPHERALAQSNTDIQVAQSASFVYGESLTFEVTATAATVLDSALLTVKIANREDVYSEAVPVSSGSVVSATRTVTVEALRLTPFARLAYFWNFHDQNGNQYRSPEQPLLYEDTSVPWTWKRTNRGHITINTNDRDQTVETTALEIATAALAEQSQTMGSTVQNDISVYVYPDLAPLVAGLRLHGQQIHDWVAAYAIPDQHIVLIASASGPEMLPNMERDLPHEITHVIIYDIAGKAAMNVPGWLSEGLALGSAPTLDPTFKSVMDKSIDQGILLSLETLCMSNFSGLPPRDTALAYAQSESVVQYISSRYGASQIQALLAAYANGLSCSSGVERALGISLPTLETQWHAQLARAAVSTPGQETSLIPWILVWVISLILAFLFIAPQPHPAEEKSAYDTQARLSSAVSDLSPGGQQNREDKS
jgi:hypothetical protein